MVDYGRGRFMSKAPFLAKDMSLEARKFLYACAFWAVAVDEQLKPAEQEWLETQFGAEGATKSLDEFVDLESDVFFQVFDSAANALSDDDRKKILPDLESWLISCIESDVSVTAQDRDIVERIKERLSLDYEIDRLLRGGSAAHPAVSARQAASRSINQAERIFAGHTGEITSVDVSCDGKYVVSGAEDCSVRLWDYASGKQVKILRGHEAGIGDICFCNDGRSVLSGDRLGQIRLWSVETGKPVWVSDGRKRGGVTGLALLPDGKGFVYSSDIGLAGLLNMQEGKVVLVFGAKKRGALHDVAVSRDGKFLLTAGNDKTVRMWAAGSGEERMVFQGHEDGVISVCFSNDGKQVLSGSRDNTVRLWDKDSGEEIGIFRGHTFSVYGVCFSPDCSRVLSASWDHSVRIWNVQTGKLEFRIESLDSRFSNITCHPDGRSVIIGGSDKNVHIVDIAGGA